MKKYDYKEGKNRIINILNNDFEFEEYYHCNIINTGFDDWIKENI